MAFLLESWWFLRVRKKYWLLPVLLMMVVFGGLIVLTQWGPLSPRTSPRQKGRFLFART
jgi:hypothetical protein